jgi:hypothetical protein
MESPRLVHIIFDDGSTEDLLLTSVGPNTYRAEESSMLGEFSYKDLIEAQPLSDGSLQFLKIVTPSGLKTNSWILPKGIIESEGFRVILDSVMKLGGNWEQVFGGLLLVHLPPEVADAVEARINHFQENPGTQI